MKDKKIKFNKLIEKLPSWVIVVIIVTIIIGLNIIGSIGDIINPYKEDIMEKLENELEETEIDEETLPIKLVKVIDFSEMTNSEIKNWCKENDIICSITYRAVENISKNNFVKQNIKAGKKIYEGDMVSIVYSLGRKETEREYKALEKAQLYADMLNASKKETYNELLNAKEKFTEEEIKYAMDNIVINWGKNALEKAKVYSSMVGMNNEEIHKQLVSNLEGFTEEDVKYVLKYFGLK